jgi:hypothetical protein
MPLSWAGFTIYGNIKSSNRKAGKLLKRTRSDLYGMAKTGLQTMRDLF